MIAGWINLINLIFFLVINIIILWMITIHKFYKMLKKKKIDIPDKPVSSEHLPSSP